MSKSSSRKFTRLKTIDNGEPLMMSGDLLKVVVIGESGAGKSNLIHRLVDGQFDIRSKSTIGIDFALFEFQHPVAATGRKRPQTMQCHKAQIWDTAGQERYRSSMTKIFYRDVSGALLVFDLTQREHFQEIKRWLREIRSNVHHIDSNSGDEIIDQIPIVLVGNKVDRADIAREVDKSEGDLFAKQHRLVDYIETSAKTGENVNNAFMKLFHNILLPNRNETINEKSKRKTFREPSIKLSHDKQYQRNKSKYKNNNSQQQKVHNKCNC